jgi:hypothetical protein
MTNAEVVIDGAAVETLALWIAQALNHVCYAARRKWSKQQTGLAE